MQLQDMTHKDNSPSLFGKLTIVIPVRIECEERGANLRTILRHVIPLGCRIIVLEADSESKLGMEEWQGKVDYVFIEDINPIFHRTKYINILLNRADTKTVSVWDTDVLVDLDMVYRAVQLISAGYTLVYPYNGEFVWLSNSLSQSVRRNTNIEDLRHRKLKPIFGRRFCGGIYTVDRLHYLECGGENENFTGWGPEDAERLRRVKILGHKTIWIPGGQAYHLWHPRGKNSWFSSKDEESRLKMEMVNVSSMTKEELYNYISNEKWNITRN